LPHGSRYTCCAFGQKKKKKKKKKKKANGFVPVHALLSCRQPSAFAARFSPPPPSPPPSLPFRPAAATSPLTYAITHPKFCGVHHYLTYCQKVTGTSLAVSSVWVQPALNVTRRWCGWAVISLFDVQDAACAATAGCCHRAISAGRMVRGRSMDGTRARRSPRCYGSARGVTDAFN